MRCFIQSHYIYCGERKNALIAFALWSDRLSNRRNGEEMSRESSLILWASTHHMAHIFDEPYPFIPDTILHSKCSWLRYSHLCVAGVIRRFLSLSRLNPSVRHQRICRCNKGRKSVYFKYHFLCDSCVTPVTFSGASFSKCLSNVRPNSDVFNSSPSKSVRTTPLSKHFRKLKHVPSFNVTAFE